MFEPCGHTQVVSFLMLDWMAEDAAEDLRHTLFFRTRTPDELAKQIIEVHQTRTDHALPGQSFCVVVNMDELEQHLAQIDCDYDRLPCAPRGLPLPRHRKLSEMLQSMNVVSDRESLSCSRRNILIRLYLTEILEHAIKGSWQFMHTIQGAYPRSR